MSSESERHCPVCGVPNSCGIAGERGSCWCFATHVNAELLELLAERSIEGRCLCTQCASGRVPSPCVDDCRLDATGTACGGCRRTMDEIAAWSTMTPAERAGVLLRLAGPAPQG